MRPRLDATNIGFLDLADQPPSSHVLIVAEHFGSRCAMAVDYAEPIKNTTSFYRYAKGSGLRGNQPSFEDTCVVVLPNHLTWLLVDRATLSPLSTSAYLEKVAKDNVEVAAKVKELNDTYKVQLESLVEKMDGPVPAKAVDQEGAYL